MSTTEILKTRVHNFSAGPAVLPEPVLERARDELVCLPGVGASVLEISHRSSDFKQILANAEQKLTKLLKIPENYRILFLQGGSRLQFSMIPQNLATPEQTAQYIITGTWGKKAFAEAKKECQAEVVWSGDADNYHRVPSPDEYTLRADAAYVYYTSNETIQGVQFPAEPVAEAPLVCDASSDFLCRPLPINKYGLLYACAQKNSGPAGVTTIVIREDLLARSRDELAGYMNYQEHAKAGSMFNTPPTFAIYMVGLVADWLLNDVGGLDAMLERNQQKATMLYNAIDESGGFYRGHAQPASRSLMNVTFVLPSKDLEAQFLHEANEHQLCNLGGHRSVGGIRASIYNALPVASAEALRDFMVEFARKNG
ncbi:MAG: 3-phosphoserine/phosphohydroxythreonine transaminase [Planctomycetota bacterium]